MLKLFIAPWNIPVWVGYVLILIGLITVAWFLLALRDPEQGFKKLLMSAIIASACLGFGIYIFLVSLGL
ncbi:MAG: hypothetical protein QXN15_01770 [Candidatus Jordarchaeales archaeon]